MDPELLERTLKREKARRLKAEQLLEDKSRELFLSYQTLQESHGQLASALEEVKSQQRQLVQSEKLASLGTMSAGIAHEINNPLAFVFSNINSLSHSVDEFRRYHDEVGRALNADSTDTREKILGELAGYIKDADIEFLFSDCTDLIDETREGIERVKSIVAGLKAFARTDSGSMEDVDVLDCLRSTLKLAHNQIKYNMEVTEQYDNLPLIKGYPGKLSQVFLNLIVNASQAMDNQTVNGTGKLSISARVIAGSAIKLSFQDNGTGMPQETIDCIFNPFFTTKEVGEGTGLGLSISHGIIEEHSGSIEVSSEPGAGTCFTITLPLNDAMSSASTTSSASNDEQLVPGVDPQKDRAS